MMGIHQNYPMTWGTERMEGLTLDLGLDGMFSPLPAEANPVGAKDSDPLPSWKYYGHSQAQPHIIDLDDDDDDDNDKDNDNPCAILESSNKSVETEQKQDMFTLSPSIPPQTPRRHPHPHQQQQVQQLINLKVEREVVELPNLNAALPCPQEEILASERNFSSDTEVPIPLKENLASETNFGFDCWRPPTQLPPAQELHLYGSGGDNNAEDFDTITPGKDSHLNCTGEANSVPDFDSITVFPDFKPVRCASGSTQHTASLMHPDTIILTDDDSDDELYFEEQYPALEERSVSPPPSSGGSRRASQERGLSAIPQSLPLRQIKQHVRSYRSDEDYSCVTPSPFDTPEITECTPEITEWKQYGAKYLESGEQGKQSSREVGEQGRQSNSKRVRGDSDHDLLPSDLFDASQSIRQNDAKRARGSFGEDALKAAYNATSSAQSTASSVQGRKQNPVHDVNAESSVYSSLNFSQDMAAAFDELIRINKIQEETTSSVTSYVVHNDPPPLTPVTVNQPYHASDEMQSSRLSVLTENHQNDSPPPPTATVSAEEASHSSDEMDSGRSISTSEFDQNDSPPLVNFDQAFPPVSGGGPFVDLPAESVSLSQCSHPLVYTQQVTTRKSNADVVLYEPKPEPVQEESWRENNLSGSVVHVKEEQLHYEPIPDQVPVRPPVGGENALGFADRNLIRTALDTFEQVRQQILKDPSYGQPDLQAGGQEAGARGNNRRLRADLKAACLMRKRGYWLNTVVRPIGAVPGVAVGDVFRYRIEMAVIGLHRAVQAGIAVVPLGLSPYGCPVASSVVIGVADPYQDDNDMGDTVVYSGQGGLCGRTKESQDQKLQRGNLAMYNSWELKLPVRLIRGHRQQDNVVTITYSYDGLYQIMDTKYVPGVNGKKVYKFYLTRLPGQAPIMTSYPAPLGSQLPPPGGTPTQNAVHWTEAEDVKPPLYLEKRPVAASRCTMTVKEKAIDSSFLAVFADG